VIPHRTDVAFPVGTQRVKPGWQWRRLWLGGAFFEEDDPILAEVKQAGVSLGTLAELESWQRRNRVGADLFAAALWRGAPGILCAV
jgi:hypothetical protein